MPPKKFKGKTNDEKLENPVLDPPLSLSVEEKGKTNDEKLENPVHDPPLSLSVEEKDFPIEIAKRIVEFNDKVEKENGNLDHFSIKGLYENGSINITMLPSLQLLAHSYKTKGGNEIIENKFNDYYKIQNEVQDAYHKIRQALKSDEEHDEKFQNTIGCKKIYTCSNLANIPLAKKFNEISEQIEQYIQDNRALKVRYKLYKESSHSDVLNEETILIQYKTAIQGLAWYPSFNEVVEEVKEMRKERERIFEEMKRSEKALEWSEVEKYFDSHKVKMLKNFAQQEILLNKLKSFCFERSETEKFILIVNSAYNTYIGIHFDIHNAIKIGENFVMVADECLAKLTELFQIRQKEKDKHLELLNSKLTPPRSLLPTALKNPDQSYLFDAILCTDFGLHGKKKARKSLDIDDANRYYVEIKNLQEDKINAVEEIVTKLGCEHKVIAGDVTNYIFQDAGASSEALKKIKNLLIADVFLKTKELFKIC